MLTCPESRYLPECHLSTGLECVCGAVVVQLHHAAIAELKAVGLVAHLPAGALCHLINCAFQHWRRLVAYSGLWGFYGNQTCVRNRHTLNPQHLITINAYTLGKKKSYYI